MRALVIVDVQSDFCPGGALAVEDGDAVVPVINRLQEHYDLVVAAQDWHPRHHGSFAVEHGKSPGEVVELDGLQQTLWPVHCVQGEPGAELVAELDRERIARVFRKGTDPRVDSYSGFFDNGHRQATGLAEYLKSNGVMEVHVAGLATDYCVKYTALDARELGFDTCVVADACRGVDLEPGDVERAIGEMRAAGVRILESRDIQGGRSAP
jgi:nicotinamidase/pyrazinamidase